MVDVANEPLQVYRSRGISGGVNTWAHPIDIRDDESVELQNITTDTPGIRAKRMGTTIVATGITAGPIYGIGSRSNELCVVSASHDSSNDHKRLWIWDGTGSQFTYVGSLTGYTADGLYRVVQCWDVGFTGTSTERSIVILPPDGSTGVKRWYYDGSTLGQVHWGKNDPPIGPEFEYFMNYGFAVGFRRSSVYMSNLASPLVTGFRTPANQFLMGGDTDHKIVAIRGFRSREVIVFMTNRIEELVVGDPDIMSQGSVKFGGEGGIGTGSPIDYTARRVIDTTIGCASRHAIAKVSEDMYFADQRGNIRSLARTALDASQGTKSLPLSIKIQSYIDRINGSALDQICATSYDRFYIVAFPLDGASSPDHVFVYDTVRSAWDGPWTGIDPKCFKTTAVVTSAAAAADKIETVFAGTSETSEGRVVRLYRGSSDAGSSIAYQETTKRITGGQFELDKVWFRLEVVAVATDDVDLTIEANVSESGWVTIGTMNLLGSAPQLPIDLTFDLGGEGLVIEKFSLESLQRSRDIQLRFTADTTSDVKVLGYTIFYFVENLEWSR